MSDALAMLAAQQAELIASMQRAHADEELARKEQIGRLKGEVARLTEIVGGKDAANQAKEKFAALEAERDIHRERANRLSEQLAAQGDEPLPEGVEDLPCLYQMRDEVQDLPDFFAETMIAFGFPRPFTMSQLHQVNPPELRTLGEKIQEVMRYVP